jgi:hypothetical protein
VQKFIRIRKDPEQETLVIGLEIHFRHFSELVVKISLWHYFTYSF